MADDELSAPLGKSAKKERRRFRLPIRIPHVIAGMLGLFVLACAAWALMVDDPFGGEPIAVVATGFDPPKSGPALPTMVSAQGPRSYDGPAGPAPKQAAVPTPTQPAAAPVPASHPNTMAVAANKLIALLFRALSTIAIVAELDCINDVSKNPSSKKNNGEWLLKEDKSTCLTASSIPVFI